MLSVSALLRCRASRSGRITDDYQLVISKKAVLYDYVAIDVGALVGGALRLTRAVAPTEQRRAKEVGRLVSQHLLQLLRRVQPTRALFLTVDGAAPLWVAAASRSAAGATRRAEARLARLPASPLMQAVEDRVVRMLPDSRIGAREVVWCGAGVAGTTEEKLTAWALDVAARPGFDGTKQSLALVGGTDLYLNAWALTNHYCVSSLVERNADLMQLDTPALLTWLGLDALAAEGANVAVARARTDMLFLFLLCQGMSAMDLGLVTPLHFPHLMTQYQRHVLQRGDASEGDSSPPTATASGEAQSSTDAAFLFEDVEGNVVELNVDHLITLLADGARHSDIRAVHQPRVDDYLEHALQVHAQLCCGETPDDTFVPIYFQPSCSSTANASTASAAAATGSMSGANVNAELALSRRAAASVTVAELVGHLLALVKADSLASFVLSRRTAVPHEALRRRARQRTGRRAYLASFHRSAPEAAAATTPPSTTTEEEEGKTTDSTAAAAATADSPRPLLAMQPALFWSPAQPLTAAEATILSQHAPSAVEDLLRSIVGVPPLPNAGKLIVQAPSVEEAHRRTQTALAFAFSDQTASSPQSPSSRAVCLGPSYCWTQQRQSKLWCMAYVDVGPRGREAEIRRRGNAQAGLVLSLQSQRTGPQWYNAASSAWVSVPRFPLTAAHDAGGSALPPQHPPLTTLRLLTWNVMFDRYSGQPTPLGMPGIDWCSPQRYPVLAKVMQREEADMIGMQEVEPAFLSFLAAQPYFRENYIFSCGADSDVIAPWGVVLLIHRRLAPYVTAVEHVNIPAWSGHVKLMPVATLRLASGMVHIAATHLLAPFSKQNVNARTTQDEVLRRYLVKSIPTGHDCIAMGDFNDWPTSEFVMPDETRYVECWPLLHPKSPGNTMDETNTFCKLKIEEIFFGRSDKFFLRSGRLKPLEAHLIGTKSVNEENGNHDAPDYLFPSDHYGVSMSFTL